MELLYNLGHNWSYLVPENIYVDAELSPECHSSFNPYRQGPNDNPRGIP